MSDLVRLRVGGVVFEVEKSTLLRFEHTYFHGMLSGPWQPDADGAYYIDRPVMGFDRILDYLRSGKLSVEGLEGLTRLEEECVYSHLNYFLIPYKRQWKYNTQSMIKGFRANYVCELKDGRLCGAYGDDIKVWNVDTSAIDMTLRGHKYVVNGVMQLQDGRLCTCSDDSTIKLWNIDSGVCELTLTGHTNDVRCIIELFDRRLCSGSWDDTIRVWNISTGVCEANLITQRGVRCIAQLSDGRICCGDSDGIISIYSLLTGECELSWKGRSAYILAIACIDATRICSVADDDRTIKVWNKATGECERTLVGHTRSGTSMVLMQDGRLCSASYDGTLKLWNLETGECEKTLNSKNGCRQVLQLEDGRLLSTHMNSTNWRPFVLVWS